VIFTALAVADPIFGVTSEGVVAKTTFPDPVVVAAPTTPELSVFNAAADVTPLIVNPLTDGEVTGIMTPDAFVPSKGELMHEEIPVVPSDVMKSPPEGLPNDIGRDVFTVKTAFCPPSIPIVIEAVFCVEKKR
jgi:hypothetical protein